jgi:alkylmercury lyase
MSTPTTHELLATWRRRRNDTNRGPTGAVVNLLADGHPVTVAALADLTGWSVEQVGTYLENARQSGVEVDGDAIVGMALTLRPTQHRFRVRGNVLYTWCGFDALFLPVVLEERAEVESRCPVTGAEIRLTVEADGKVSAATPSTAAVAIVGEDVTSCCQVTGPGSAICSQMPLFASREAGERWLIDHPGVAVVDLDDARRIALTYVHG